MKIFAVNGSPRKNGNTARLLQHALDGAAARGAETRLIHLYDLNYRGCTSCFACKQKDNPHAGRFCAMKDGLTPFLEAFMSSGAVFLGSPIYLGDVTGAMRSFLERFLFVHTSYQADRKTEFKGKLASLFIYTMNMPQAALYQSVFEIMELQLQRLNGPVRQLICTDTLQFQDYSRYDASRFDPEHKKSVHETQFPKDCKEAYRLGKKLAAVAKK